MVEVLVSRSGGWMQKRVITGDSGCHFWLFMMRTTRNKLVVERENEGN